MADDDIHHSHSSKNLDAIGSKPILCKVAQVVLVIFAVGLIITPFNSFSRREFGRREPSLDEVGFIYITFGAYLIINVVLIIYHVVLEDSIPKRLSLMFTTVGAIFHLIAAILIVNIWRKLNGGMIKTYNNEVYGSKTYMDMTISSGIFTFLTTGAFIADIYFTIRY